MNESEENRPACSGCWGKYSKFYPFSLVLAIFFHIYLSYVEICYAFEYFYIFYMYEYFVCLYITCMPVASGDKKIVSSPGTEVTNGCGYS